MDKRLRCIYNCINHDALGVIDVGTDHGYIPVQLCRDGYSGNIIASDINAGPLNSAVKNAEAANCAHKIEFILSAGLEKCPHDKIDTVVIAGMGGDTITKILDNDYWCCREGTKLILQPMTKHNILRYWLIHNEFEITGEQLVHDMGRTYQVIIAEKGNSGAYTDAELYVGKYIRQDTALYQEQALACRARTQKKIDGTNGRTDSYQARYARLLLESLDKLLEVT